MSSTSGPTVVHWECGCLTQGGGKSRAFALAVGASRNWYECLVALCTGRACGTPWFPFVCNSCRASSGDLPSPFVPKFCPWKRTFSVQHVVMFQTWCSASQRLRPRRSYALVLGPPKNLCRAKRNAKTQSYSRNESKGPNTNTTVSILTDVEFSETDPACS